MSADAGSRSGRPGPVAQKHRDPLPLGFRSRIPLGFQLLIGIGSLVALVAVCGAAGLVMVSNVQGDTARLNDRNLPFAESLGTAALSAKGMANDERGFLMTGEATFVDEFRLRLEDARAAFRTAAATAATDQQRRVVGQARTGFERWVAGVEDEFATFPAGDRDPASAVLGPNRALRKTYEDALAEAQALASGAIESDQRTIAAASSRTVRIAVIVLTMAVAVGSGVMVWVIRTILKPVQGLYRLFAEVRSLGAA